MTDAVKRVKVVLQEQSSSSRPEWSYRDFLKWLFIQPAW
jgi:hypothetical protein